MTSVVCGPYTVGLDTVYAMYEPFPAWSSSDSSG